MSGWHAALGEMSSPAHSYFFPAGAALMAGIAVALLLARRAWNLLGKRLEIAQIGLWRRPQHASASGSYRPTGPPSLLQIWIVLFVLQTGTWAIQENLESVAIGRQAPLLGVMSGVHWLAPLIQAEIALIFGVIYWLFQRRFTDRRTRVTQLERLVAQKWTPGYGLLPVLSRASKIASTPLDRWGAQRWQRPPPAALAS